MRILVTGGAGFIGSHVADRYVKMGHTVAVLDNLSTGSKANVNPQARLYVKDLCDPDLISVFQDFRPEVVNHQAAQVNVRRSVEDPLFDARVNVSGSIALYRCAAESGCRKVIYASSGGALYGNPDRIPADEETPVRPLCPYGVSKHVGEQYLRLFAELHGMRFTILRYANVYGPRQNAHGEAGVVAVFTELLLDGKPCTIFGDGSKTRDYVYVGDVAKANALALEGGEGRAFNVGTGRRTTDQEMYDALRAAVGVEARPLYSDFRKGEVRHIALDTSRIRAELGWQAATPLEQGIPLAVEFYRSARGRA